MNAVRVLPLGEVVRPIRPRVKPSDRPDLPFIGMEHVEAHSMKLLGTVPAATMKSSAVHFKPGDVLYGRLRPYLNKVYRPTFEGLCSAEFIVLPQNERIDGRYLQYFLNSAAFVRYATHLNAGDRPRIDFDQVAPYQIPLPGVSEQGRIVAEIEKQFSRLDQAVANLKRVKANLKRQRTSVLQAVTSGRLAAEGQAAPRQEAWRWLTIEELASAAPRSIQSGPFGSNLRHSEFQPQGKLVIGIDNVRDGEFSIGSNHRISESKFKELEKYSARPGDVLITVMATIGRVCVVPDDVEPAIITKHVYRITVNRELAIPDYVAIALRGSGEVRAQLMNSVQGQTRPGLNGGLIKKIRVPLPPLAYQRSIVAEVDRRLSITREVEAEVDANLKRAQALRQAVLAEAFSC